METMTSDARYEKTWHQFLSALERHLAPILRSQHIYHRGFEKWMHRHGYRVGDAKGRVLQLRMEAQASSATETSPFLLVAVGETPAVSHADLLTGIGLTLPDGTVVSIRRGSAEAVVSFLRLYYGEDRPYSD